MTRLLVLIGVCAMVTACGRSAPTGPSARAQSSSNASSGGFSASLQPTNMLSGWIDFARCLQGSLGASCFSGARVAARVIDGAALVGAPANLIASAVGGSVNLSWTAPASGDPVAAYVIEAGSASGAANLANFSTGNTATVFSASGIGAGTYFVRVRASGAAGVGAPSNEAVLVVGEGPCATPSAPAGLVVVSATGGTVVLSWTAATGSPTTYIVEAGSSAGLANLANSELGLSTSLTATGVGNGTYYVRIRTKNSCGTSAPSNEVTFAMGTTTRFTIRGTVRETAPNPTPALAGAAVEFVAGADATNVLSDQNGTFAVPNVAAQTATIRASMNGYETETKTVVVAADVVVNFALGHTWPAPIVSMLNRLPVIDGLKFKRAPGSGPSYYNSSPPVTVYVSPAPSSGEIGSIAHEVCHAHQDRLARAIGQGIYGYYDTEEGKSFLELTGWSRVGPEPTCERGWCGYSNALEDSAQTCATWYDPGGSWDSAFLSSFAPKRFQWAQRWLPR